MSVASALGQIPPIMPQLAPDSHIVCGCDRDFPLDRDPALLSYISVRDTGRRRTVAVTFGPEHRSVYINKDIVYGGTIHEGPIQRRGRGFAVSTWDPWIPALWHHLAVLLVYRTDFLYDSPHLWHPELGIRQYDSPHFWHPELGIRSRPFRLIRASRHLGCGTAFLFLSRDVVSPPFRRHPIPPPSQLDSGAAPRWPLVSVCCRRGSRPSLMRKAPPSSAFLIVVNAPFLDTRRPNGKIHRYLTPSSLRILVIGKSCA
ncbi:uncharacterized protein LOC142491404 [Ascaphus truei]|uniref:uncharacterized protein LOC142491404 n=1 Tax=Ascaphus truei TaxID=8439 RepID=UPI003F5A2521